MKPFWITFYSYKGGVGRSLALANTAALLVKRGRRVVLIDFDLEAPGLDSFHEFKSVIAKPGVVEYVTEFERTKRAPDISQFVHRCELEGELRGKLWIMPAGRKDPSYNTCRVNLDWADLYAKGFGEPFVENWKAAVARYCQPDYVFVDSRTGLTDVGGICTLHLPDLVVMVFGLNEQNVHGVAAVAKTIRESEFTRLPQIHYVASPVPNLPRDNRSPLLLRWKAVAAQLGTKIESSIHYQSMAALSERLFALDPELEPWPLVQDYQNLLDRLIDYNRSGLDFLSKQVAEAIGKVDTSLMERLLAVLEQEFPDRPESLMSRAQLKKALGHSKDASTLARRALEADPRFEDPLDWLLDNYRRGRDYEAALSVCNYVLDHAEQLSPRRRYDLDMQAGHSAMAIGQYQAAVSAYDRCITYQSERKKKGDFDPETFMINYFNDVEATRRAKREPLSEVWTHVVGLFDSAGETIAAPLVIQANRWQAMHIAFAMIGNITRAREALIKARQAAEFLGPAEDIFAVKTYTEVPVPEFLQMNTEMLAALDRGQLWDGMPVPTEKPAATEPNTEQGK